MLHVGEGPELQLTLCAVCYEKLEDHSPNVMWPAWNHCSTHGAGHTLGAGVTLVSPAPPSLLSTPPRACITQQLPHCQGFACEKVLVQGLYFICSQPCYLWILTFGKRPCVTQLSPRFVSPQDSGTPWHPYWSSTFLPEQRGAEESMWRWGKQSVQ